MPPPVKKAPKLKKNGGPKTVVPADYIRSPLELQELTNVPPLEETLIGNIINVDVLYPEWDVSEEVWADGTQNVTEPIYPAHIAAAAKSYRNILDMLDVTVPIVADAGKGGKDTKKKVVTKSNEFEEILKDEQGSIFPRLFLDSFSKKNESPAEEEAKGFKILWPFLTEPSPEISADENDLSDADSTESPQQHGDFFNQVEFPADKDRDPVMCTAFKFVERFGSNWLRAAEGPNGASVPAPDFPFLWRAVYPQNSAGKPCLNPAGKYCVKLFFGGRWRKVTVSDVLPVAGDGRPALASSSENFDLWPSILAKAVYSVFSASGYCKTFPSMSMDESGPGSAHSAGCFLGFVLHVLTGWDQGNPWSVTDTMYEDTDRLGGLLQEVCFGGALVVPPQDIPDRDPSAKKKFEQEESAKERKMTKKQRRAELKRKMEEKDRLLRSMNDRYRNVERIDNNCQSPFSEVFAIAMPADDAGVKLWPILAVSVPEDQNVSNILFLVSWSASDPPPIVVDIGADISVVSEAAQSDQKQVESLWVSVGDLCIRSAFIVGMDTRFRTQHKVEMPWRWCVPTAEDRFKTVPKGGKDTGKAGKDASAKGKKAESVPVSVEIPTVPAEPGPFPPTLLCVDTEQFMERYNASEEKALVEKVAAERAVRKPYKGELTGLESDEDAFASLVMRDNPNREALQSRSASSNKKLAGEPDTQVLKKSRTYLSLSVRIHADIVFLEHPDDPLHRVGSAMASGSPDSAKRKQSRAIVFAAENYPPEAVLVLQEVRFDGKEPLVMRVQIGESNPLPFARITFNVPADRVAPKRFVFWLRVFTRSSLSLSFSCSCPVTVGPAADQWTAIGGQTLTLSGELDPTGPGYERLLMRTPLQIQSGEEADVQAAVSPTLDDFSLCFLEVSQKAIAPFVSLVLQDDATTNAMVLPRLEGNVFALSSRSPKTVIARCFHPTRPLPAFSWRLTCLQQTLLIPPPQPEPVSTKRFQSVYIPNNKLVLFRDVVKADSEGFPIALRLSVHPMPGEDGLEPENALDTSVSLVVRTYRKSDKKLVASYRSLGIVQVYKIDPEPFMSDQDAEVDAGHHVKGGKGAAKKDDKAKKKKDPTCVEFIIECALDESAMEIPPSWRSRAPLEFSNYSDLNADAARASYEESVACRLAIEPQFFWRLDIIGGQILSIGHDTADLERLAALKNSWESGSAGREDRAAYAVSYIAEIKRVIASLPESTYQSQDEMGSGARGSPIKAAGQSSSAVSMARSPSRVGKGKAVVDAFVSPFESAAKFLATAVSVDPDLARTREELAATLSKYEEYSESLPEGDTPDFIDTPQLELAKSGRGEDVADSQSKASKAVERLQKFNEDLRTASKARIFSLVDGGNTNLDEIKQAWLRRDKYKAFVEKKNEVLKQLIEQATQAIETATAGEDPDAAKKEKGKGKKSSKKK